MSSPANGRRMIFWYGGDTEEREKYQSGKRGLSPSGQLHLHRHALCARSNTDPDILALGTLSTAMISG